MIYDFDRVIERRGTDCEKFDFAAKHGVPEDALPLWVADMDFRAPQPVRDKLAAMAEHGIFGYSGAKEDYYEAAAGWFERRHGWRPEPAWLVQTPGVVFALATAVRAYTKPGDAVVIQPPVYPPFFGVVRDNGRRVVENPLALRDGRYEMDFADLERKLDESGAKLFILCSPHNPVGRVWTPEELRRLGQICAARDVIVAADEIHCDFDHLGHAHTVFLKAAPEMAERAILCTAPSKTFNLAGLQASNIWIPGKELRERFQAELRGCGFSGINQIGLAACKTAYAQGEEWFEQCRAYLRGNLEYFRAFLRERLPELKLIEPEGTYLAWVNFSGLGLGHEALEEFIQKKAKLWLDAGEIFGTGGALHQRIVLACPRATLAEALTRLERAVKG